MTFGLVLVAWIVSSPASHVAFLIATRCAGAGAPGVRVTVAVLVTLNHVAVMVPMAELPAGVVGGKSRDVNEYPLGSVGTCYPRPMRPSLR